MPYDDDDEPLPPKPGPTRPMWPLQFAKHHNLNAPLAPNDQKVLLELKAVPSAASRLPLDLVAVIDVSSSMEGERLENAKKALTFIVRKLTDRDRLSIVKFDNEAARVCRLRRVTDSARTELEAGVSGLQIRGATNIELGLRTGLAVVEERKFTAGRASSIMLLSDGDENSGNARTVVPGNVPVHTFGFGADHDSTLLGDVAKKSLGGVYNYVQDSNDPAMLSKAFSRILAGLVTIIAQDLKLTVTPFPDEATIKMVDAGTYLPANSHGNGTSPVTVRFGAISSEETRSIIMELALRGRTAGSRSYRAKVAEVVYRFTTAQGQLISQPEKITIKRTRKAAFVTGTADAPQPVEVEVIRLRHIASIREAVETAEKNRLDEAWNILAEALRKLVEARKKLFDPILEDLQNELMKLLNLFKTEELYKTQGRPYAISSQASHGRRRSVEKGDDTAGPYDTQRVNKYIEQAQLPHEEHVSSATADEQEAAPPSPATEMRTVSVALRLLTAVLSLLAFSVVASARTPGWAGDYYGRYGPYRLVTPCTRLSFVFCFFFFLLLFLLLFFCYWYRHSDYLIWSLIHINCCWRSIRGGRLTILPPSEN
jgi:hypothetical protein